MVEVTDNGCEIHPCPSSSLSPSLPFLQPAWFLMVGGDRIFKLALTENDEEFSDELQEDFGVSRDGEKGEGVGRGRRRWEWRDLEEDVKGGRWDGVGEGDPNQ